MKPKIVAYRTRESINQYLQESGMDKIMNPIPVNSRVVPFCVIESDEAPWNFMQHLERNIESFPSSAEKNRIQSYLSDRQALMDIHDAANGLKWTKRRNWKNFEVPVGDWAGVTMRTDLMLCWPKQYRIYRLGRVVKLDLSHNNMHRGYLETDGVISPEIGKLTELRFLHLGYNFLMGGIPNEIYTLSKLEELYLHFNELSGGISQDIKNLKNLKKLQLDHNRLYGPIPEEIDQLVDLERLGLHENNLDNQLSAAGVESQVPIPAGIANLQHLQMFYAYGNQLHGILDERLKRCMHSRNEWKLVKQQNGNELG